MYDKVDVAIRVVMAFGTILTAIGAGGIFLQLVKNSGALKMRRSDELTEFRKSLMVELDQVKAEARAEIDALKADNKHLEECLRKLENEQHKLGIDFASYRASVRQMVMMMRHRDPRWEELASILINTQHDVDKLILGDKAETPAIDSKNILVIDDDVDALNVLNLCLTVAGHHVETASSGPVAIDKFTTALSQGRPFDLVITDLAMPVMSGDVVATSIRNVSAGTPIVFFTGHAGDLSEEVLQRIGNCDVWIKPLSADDLKRRVRGALKTFGAK